MKGSKAGARCRTRPTVIADAYVLLGLVPEGAGLELS